MEPVAVSVTVAKPREEVFDHLDVLANHAPFLDHMYRKTGPSPARRAAWAPRARPGQRPGSQRSRRVRGRRVRAARCGSSRKASAPRASAAPAAPTASSDRPDGGTEIDFELAWTAVPRSERIFPPLSRAFLRRALGKAMRRLGKELDGS